MWIFLWAILSFFILGVFVWSMRTLWRQKKAWAKFAQSHKLEYKSGRFNDPPSVTGRMGGHRVALFTDARQVEGVRGQHYITVIEISVNGTMPTGGVIATAGMAPYLVDLSFKEGFVPQGEGWDENNVLRYRSAAAMAGYMTPERQKLFQSLFAMKHANVLFIFDEEDAVLRVETSDPLCNPVQIEKMMKKFVVAAEKLMMTDDEKGHDAAGASAPPAPVAQDAVPQPAVDEEGAPPPAEENSATSAAETEE